MGFPAKAKTWTITANNVVADATLALMVGDYLKLMADFLLANGYTCKGSSDGVTGAMDATNRWTTIALASVKGATTGAAQSWMVLTDGSGCDILLANVGASAHFARFGYSPGGNYVAAGTPTFTPTATDELVLTAAGTGGQDAVGSTAAPAQRNFFGWVDSTSKLCRFLITLHSSNVPAGATWGVELIDTARQQRTISPAVWGFCFATGDFQFSVATNIGIPGAFSQGTRGGRILVNAQAVGINGGPYFFGGSANIWGNVQTELQGTLGYPIWDPFSLGSVTAGWLGPVGHTIDWWSCRQASNGALAQCGDTYDAKNFMAVAANSGILWPWDGSTTPVTGTQASIAQSGNNTGFENADDPANGSLLNQNSEYVPLANSAVTPTGPTSPQAIARRPGVDVIRINDMSADPPAETGRTLVYSRTIAGQQALFARYPDGTVYMVGAG